MTSWTVWYCCHSCAILSSCQSPSAKASHPPANWRIFACKKYSAFENSPHRLTSRFLLSVWISDAVASFLQEFCLRKKFLQDTRNLARILHLVKVKKNLVFAIFGQGEILILKRNVKILEFFWIYFMFQDISSKKNFWNFFYAPDW